MRAKSSTRFTPDEAHVLMGGRLTPTFLRIGFCLIVGGCLLSSREARAADVRTAPEVGGTALSGTGAFQQTEVGHGLQALPLTGQTSVQVRTNILDSDTLRAGPLVDLRPSSRRHPDAPAIGSREDDGSVRVGGYFGYLFHDDTGAPTSSLGLDLQVGSDRTLGNDGLMVQPGVDYSRPLSPSMQLSTRLFSTLSPNGPLASGLLDGDGGFGLRSGSDDEGRLKDVGVGLGVGLSVSDRWNIQTEARYQRNLRAGSDGEGSLDNAPHQFFGGVMIDYKF